MATHGGLTEGSLSRDGNPREPLSEGSLHEQGAGSREGNREQGSYRRNAMDHGTAVRGWQATQDQRSIDPLTALAATISLLRPDWRHDTIRAVLVRTSGSWHDIALRALHAALDPQQHTPLGIENADMRPYAPTPTPPSIDELTEAGLLPQRRTTT